MGKGGLKEVSKAKHEREVPRCSGARAGAIEVPDWLTSAVRNSTGGGSRQSWSHDKWGVEGRAPSMAVNKEEQEGESEAAGLLCAAPTTLSQQKCTIAQFLWTQIEAHNLIWHMLPLKGMNLQLFPRCPKLNACVNWVLADDTSWIVLVDFY